MITQIGTLFKVHPIKYYTQLKDEDSGSNTDATVYPEFSRLPELVSEVGERNFEFVEQLSITMQNNLNKYVSTVGLEFAVDVTVEDELVVEFAVQKKWNTRIHLRNSNSETRLED